MQPDLQILPRHNYNLPDFYDNIFTTFSISKKAFSIIIHIIRDRVFYVMILEFSLQDWMLELNPSSDLDS